MVKKFNLAFVNAQAIFEIANEINFCFGSPGFLYLVNYKVLASRVKDLITLLSRLK